MLNRAQLRTEIRNRRQQLSAQAQQDAAIGLVRQLLPCAEVLAAQHIALYLSNDSEINTTALIQALWQAGKTLYLPILHPFCAGYLIFQRYQPTTPLLPNRFGIPEPKLNCAELLPVQQLDLIFTPLVAFDSLGQRLGMGGGFYDRTLSQLAANHHCRLIGLAHDCQQVPQLPVEPWDQPLHAVATGSRLLRFSR